MRKPTIRRGIERGIDVVGEILAFLAVALWVVVLAQAAFGFIDPGITVGDTGMTLVSMLQYIAAVSMLIVFGLKGLEFALKRGWIIFIIYMLLIAACIVFMCMPDALTNLFGAAA